METRVITALFVVATIAAGVSVGVGVAGSVAQSEEGSVHFAGTGPFDRTVGVGETLTYETVLNDVDSVDRFEYEFAVEEPSTLRIEDVEPGPGVSEFDATIGPDNATVTLRGTGAEVENSGYVDRHALVTVRGVANGTTDLVPRVADVQVGNESAGDLETHVERITVTERPITDVEMRPGVDVSGSRKIEVDDEGEAIVAAEHADRGVGGFEVNLSSFYADERDVRFVDATVQGDPEEQSIQFGPNGTYVEVAASGLDGEATGDVHLLDVTLRGVESDGALLDTDVDTLRTPGGTPYEIDTVLLATANVTAVSERGTPPFTAPPRENGTAVPAETTDAGGPGATTTSDAGGSPTATTDASGPGFVALAALLAMTIAASLALVRRRSRRP